jgi:CheY-like chemotaxis protein
MIKKSINILLLQNPEDDTRMIEGILSKNELVCNIKQVSTREDFIAALTYFYSDIILADHSVRDLSVIDAVVLARQANIKRVPVIMITQSLTYDFAKKFLQLGGDGYLVKGHLQKLSEMIRSLLDKYQVNAS